MRSALQLKLSQHFALTPQLHQSIKLLQLSTIDLTQEVENTLTENIFLERDDGSDLPERRARDGEPARAAAEATPTAAQPGSSTLVDMQVPYARRRERDDFYDFVSTQYPDALTLAQHLRQQLGLLNLSPRDHDLGCTVIGMLDENGYLPQPLDDLQQWLPVELAVEPDELHLALRHVQALDPPGVGARSISECLKLQLETMPHARATSLALALVREHLQLLATRDFPQMKKLLNCSDTDLRAAYQLIKQLNPKPGAGFGRDDVRYIAPDVIVKRTGKGWTALLNAEVVPRIRLNQGYVEAIKRSGNHAQFSTQLQEARWMIKNIQQRLHTILRVSQAIVERQHNFLDHGEIAMRPLVLREIADILELHESTVSRVTTQKYMQTPRGTYELKYFFGSHVATDTGGACSATAIRAMIKQLVNAEDSARPISDNQIARILSSQGIVVARRTVAKYRDSMNIAAVNLRRSI